MVEWFQPDFLAQNVSFNKSKIPRSGKFTKCALLAIFFSKVLAARKTNLITCPELAKINALLAWKVRNAFDLFQSYFYLT